MIDIGPGPRIDTGVNFPGLPRHDGQRAREEMPCHLPGFGEHRDGGTYLFTDVPRKHWQQRHDCALRLLSTIAKGRFLLDFNQLIWAWTLQGTIQPCLHSSPRDVNITSGISTAISSLKHRVLPPFGHKRTQSFKEIEER